jgi:hypothetical protein
MATSQDTVAGGVVIGRRVDKVSFSVDTFRSRLGSIVRPNLFSVKFVSLPSIIGEMGYKLTDASVKDLEFRCERAEMPGKTIATTDEVSLGPTLKLPYETTFSDIQLTIICAEDMFERRFFESWMDEIVALPGGHGLGGLVRYYDEFAEGSQILVAQAKSDGTSILEYVLYDAFPIALSPMTLAWEESNTYQRFTVTMSYRYHVMTYPTPAY